MMPQNLKLPICPKCNDTKNVVSYDFTDPKSYYEKHNASYNCKSCNISWNYRDIVEGGPCFTCEAHTPTQFYGWAEYGMAILDRKIINE